MKLTILGGTGLIGRRLANVLRKQGHEVKAVSRSTGVDLLSDDGLQEALAGADDVVDTSNSGYADVADAEHFFTKLSRNLVEAARASGVEAIAVLSAVGADEVDNGYYRAKKLQEEEVKGSGLAYTIVRSTPFFEFIYKIVDAGGEGNMVRVPPVRRQPIAADDVAAALARFATSRPANAIIEIAGPDRYALPDLAIEILTANEDIRSVVIDPDAPYFGARFDGETLIGWQPRFGHMRFEDWLRDWFATV